MPASAATIAFASEPLRWSSTAGDATIQAAHPAALDDEVETRLVNATDAASLATARQAWRGQGAGRFQETVFGLDLLPGQTWTLSTGKRIFIEDVAPLVTDGQPRGTQITYLLEP
jgi:hypothetical protein